MEAYHLRTEEPESCSILSVTTFTLDSLLIPDAHILVGLTQTVEGERSILCYNYDGKFARRAESLAHRTDPDIKGTGGCRNSVI